MAAPLTIDSGYSTNVTDSGMELNIAMNESWNETAIKHLPVIGWSLIEKIGFGVWLSISILCATIGNLMVIVVVGRHRGMQTRTNMFLVNLAVADFMVGVLMAPFALTTLVKDGWIFGDAFCSINGFLNNMCFITSIHTLMYISIHKFVSISYPFSRKLNNSKILIMIFCTWCWSFICAILTMFVLSHVVYKPNTTQCGPEYPQNSNEYLHHIIIQVTNIVIPLFIMIFAYGRMYCEFRQHAIRLHKNTTLQHDQIIGQQKEITKTLFIVLVCFMLCWLPYAAYTTYVSMVRDKSTIPAWANPAAYCFMYMSSGFNPIIYAWRSPSFREGYKEILCQQPRYVVSDVFIQDMLMLSNMQRPSQIYNPGLLSALTLADPARENTIRESDSPSIIRRLSAMLHTSFRNTRFNSRRNSDASSIGSSPNLHSAICSSPYASHKQLRRATSKTAKGSSVIRKDGSLIITKNGKIVSIRPDKGATLLRRDQSFSGFVDRIQINNVVSKSMTELNGNIIKERIELTPLLRKSHRPDSSSSDQSQPSSHQESPQKSHRLPNSDNLCTYDPLAKACSEENVKTLLVDNTCSSISSEKAASMMDIGETTTYQPDLVMRRQLSDEVFESSRCPVLITFNSDDTALNSMPRDPQMRKNNVFAKSEQDINKKKSVIEVQNGSKRVSKISKSSDEVYSVPMLKYPSIERLDLPQGIPRCNSDAVNKRAMTAASALYTRKWLSADTVENDSLTKV